MQKIKAVMATLVVAVLLSSCAVVRPGEVGVKQRIGKLSDRVLTPGAYAFNPFTTVVIKSPVRTVNLEIQLNLPSKEGLNISSNISILYRIEESRVPYLIESIGNDYEQIIISVFRSASADICARFMAKDMHSGKRAEIEAEIAKTMAGILEEKGIVIEAVLLKSIQLPPGLYNSIESRMKAEQDALRMQFTLEQERLEAERKVIEAKGNRDAQQILSEGLTKEILELRSIEAFLKLAESEGSKVIITNGESPFLLEADD